MKVQISTIILICGVSTAALALGGSPPKKAEETNLQEINNEKTTMVVGMTEKQKEGFEQIWKKTQPRWEAEENARRLEKQGLISEAMEEYKRAIANSENDFYAETSHRALANLYEKSGQCEAALKEVEWYIARFKKMNYPNKDLLKEYEQTRSRLLSQCKAGPQ